MPVLDYSSILNGQLVCLMYSVMVMRLHSGIAIIILLKMDKVVNTVIHQSSVYVNSIDTSTALTLFPIANTTVYSNCSDGDIRLVGGRNNSEGNVQICYNNAWTSVCSDYWDTNDAAVVCRQLGYQTTRSKINYLLLKRIFICCRY